MVQVLQPRDRQRKVSGVEQFLTGAAKAIPSAIESYKGQQESRRKNQMALENAERERLFEMQKMGIQHGYNKELEELKQSSQAGKKNQDIQDKLAPFSAGLQTIQQLRNIRNKENIGFGSGFTGIFNPETRRDRSEYQTLANSLIGLASTIPIRNQKEFETLTGQLNDPSLTLAEIDGVLDGIERIISQNMQHYQGEGESLSTNIQKPSIGVPDHLKKPKKSLKSFIMD